MVQRELVIQAQHGDADAFGLLVAGAVDRLHGVAYRILHDADRADDATQQALIAAWDHLPSLRDPDRFDAWTYRLVVNAAYREARRERAQHDTVRWIPMAEPASDAAPSAIEDRDLLDRAFAELSPEHRAVLVLRYHADLTLAQIAEVLEIPMGTVGSRLHHASRHLRAALERQELGAPVMEAGLP